MSAMRALLGAVASPILSTKLHGAEPLYSSTELISRILKGLH